LDRYKCPKKILLNFFQYDSIGKISISISCGLYTGTKCEKVVLFGFSIGTKCEKLNFYTTNNLNSLLVPVLNPKSTTFSHFGHGTKTSNLRKKFIKSFFWIFVRVQIPYFWTQKNFEIILGSI
jgi:hypothetical protein